MATVHFVSDMHFLHKNIADIRGFSSVEEMNERLISNWNSVVARGDLVYCLGDVALYNNRQSKDFSEILSALRGSIHLIAGNHDCKTTRKSSRWAKVSEGDFITVRQQQIHLSHYPMLSWRNRRYGSWMLHGHCHGSLKSTEKCKRVDVGVDCWNFTPVSFDTLKPIMDAQPIYDDLPTGHSA